MIRITRQTDYGILLLSRMVLSDQSSGGRGTYSAADVAAGARMPVPMVSKILKVLTRAGILESLRGVKGGYRLNVEPEELSVNRMVTALEGPIALTACTIDADDSDGEVTCTHEDDCCVRGNWHIINQAVHEVLNNISLADMAAQSSRSFTQHLAQIGSGAVPLSHAIPGPASPAKGQRK